MYGGGHVLSVAHHLDHSYMDTQNRGYPRFTFAHSRLLRLVGLCHVLTFDAVHVGLA